MRLTLSCGPRHKIGAAQEKAGLLQSQLDRLLQDQLPRLLADMASLNVMQVVHGNYTLKLARQEYYLSKQNQVGVAMGRVYDQAGVLPVQPEPGGWEVIRACWT